MRAKLRPPAETGGFPGFFGLRSLCGEHSDRHLAVDDEVNGSQVDEPPVIVQRHGCPHRG